MKILVVDDEKDITLLIKQLVELTTDGEYEVHVAYNGNEALEVFQEIQPDFVLSDIRMPICDGPTFLENLRKIAPDIPFAFITGYHDIPTETLMKNNPLTVLKKPDDLGQIIDFIDETLKKK